MVSWEEARVTNLISFYSRIIDILQESDSLVDCIDLDLKKAVVVEIINYWMTKGGF